MAEGDAFRDPEPFTLEAQGLSLGFYPGGRVKLDALLALIEAHANSSRSHSTSTPPTKAGYGCAPR